MCYFAQVDVTRSTLPILKADDCSLIELIGPNTFDYSNTHLLYRFLCLATYRRCIVQDQHTHIYLDSTVADATKNCVNIGRERVSFNGAHM